MGKPSRLGARTENVAVARLAVTRRVCVSTDCRLRRGDATCMHSVLLSLPDHGIGGPSIIMSFILQNLIRTCLFTITSTFNRVHADNSRVGVMIIMTFYIIILL